MRRRLGRASRGRASAAALSKAAVGAFALAGLSGWWGWPGPVPLTDCRVVDAQIARVSGAGDDEAFLLRLTLEGPDGPVQREERVGRAAAESALAAYPVGAQVRCAVTADGVVRDAPRRYPVGRIAALAGLGIALSLAAWRRRRVL